MPDQTLLGLRKSIAAREVTSPGTSQLEVELVLPDNSIHPERGRVNFSDSVIDPATGSVDLRAELPNASGDLLPGQFLRVRLQGIERPDAILVPQRAVQQGEQGKFVFVVGADGKAAVKPVKVGDWLGRDWIVESGLAGGERVIVDGAVKVMPGAPGPGGRPQPAGPARSGRRRPLPLPRLRPRQLPKPRRARRPRRTTPATERRTRDVLPLLHPPADLRDRRCRS